MDNKIYECQLLEASEAGDLLKILDIINDSVLSVDFNCRNTFNDTPLILASRNAHKGIVQILLDKGADVNAENFSGDSSLISASEHPNNVDVMDILLSAGARINHKNDMGRTALIEASSIGDLQNVAFLLQFTPDVNAVTKEEETALTFAVVNEYPEVVKTLIEAGANVDWHDTMGWTALTYAINGGNEEIMNLLKAPVSNNT